MRRVAKNPSFEKSTDIALISGTTAQQFPLRDKVKLAAARAKADDDGVAVLTALRAWDGSYDRENQAGTVDPGVAIWEEFKDQAEAIYLEKIGATDIGIAGSTSNSHMFDITNGEAAALVKSGSGAYAKAATATFEALAEEFATDDVSAWREPRRLYPVGAQGAGATPELEFFDRGTWNQSIAMGT